MATMYHGSRNASLEFYPAICFTSCRSNAEAYGDHVAEVIIDRSQLNILTIEMTDEELREALDDQEFPCDRQADIERYIAEGYDAVAFDDADVSGDRHDCLRILTADAFCRAVEESATE